MLLSRFIFVVSFLLTAPLVLWSQSPVPCAPPRYSVPEQVSVCQGGTIDLSVKSIALKFDGSGDKVIVPDFHWNTNGGAITIEWWNKVNSDEVQNANAFLIGENIPGTQFLCHAPWGNKMLFWDYGDISKNGRTMADYTPYLNQWTHIALVSGGKNGNFRAIYINGNLVASANTSDGIAADLKGLSLGVYYGDQFYYKGRMDDFRIWKKVRTQQEIQENMYKTLKGNEADLAGYWDMDEGIGSKIYDKTVYENHGALIGEVQYEAPEANLTYSWSPAGNAVSSLPYFFVSPTQSTPYSITVSNGTCAATSQIQVNVSTQAASALSIAPQGTVCKGQTLQANSLPGFTYQWMQGNKKITDATNPNFTPAYSGSYFVGVKSATCSQASAVVNVTDNARTRLSLPEEVKLCAGGTIDLSVKSNALKFDGNGDKVMMPDFHWNTNGGEITIEWWNKVNSDEIQNSNAFVIGESMPGSQFLCHGPWSNKLLYWDYGNISTNGRITADYTPYYNQWTHIALVSKGVNGNFRAIYINGKMVTSANSSDGIAADLKGLFLGVYYGDQNFYKGRMDDFRIWKKVRTEREIQDNMYKTLQGNEADLAGYWDMDEGTGNVILDKTVNKNHGSFFGDVKYEASETNLTYKWSPATGLNNISSATVTASPATNMEYTLAVTNAAQCTATAGVQVIINCQGKSYYALDPLLKNAPVNIGAELNFMYKEDYIPGQLTYKIYTYKNEEFQNLISLNKVPGENYYSIDTSSLGLILGNTYLLEVTGEKGDKYFLRFKLNN